MDNRKSGVSSLAILLLLASCSGQDKTKPASLDADGSTRGSTGSSARADAGGSARADAGGSDAGKAGRADAGGSKCTPARRDAGGASGSIPATFDTVKLVFGGGGGIMTCAAAPCHGTKGAAPPDHPLELPTNDDQALYTNLLTYVAEACDGQKLVAPCDPSESALVKILKGPCGDTPRMPYGCSEEAGDCIPDEYVAAVALWIANGAPRQ